MKKPISLTGKQKRHLRALAHHLKPVVIIGSDRITPGLIKKVDTELTAHELIKIRITDGDREDLAEAEDVLCSKTRALLLGSFQDASSLVYGRFRASILSVLCSLWRMERPPNSVAADRISTMPLVLVLDLPDHSPANPPAVEELAPP